MGWVYMDDDGYPAQQPVRRAGGGFTAGLFNLFLWALVLLLIAAVGYTLFSEIRGGNEGAMPVPTAAIRTRAPAAQPAPASSGVFTTLPAPAPEPIAPVESAPLVEAAPQIPPVSADIQALPEYVQPEQSSSDIPADWQQEVFGEVAPVEAAPVSEVAQPAPEGGVAPAEVSSGIDPSWRCNVFGECGGGQ